VCIARPHVYVRILQNRVRNHYLTYGSTGVGLGHVLAASFCATTVTAAVTKFHEINTAVSVIDGIETNQLQTGRSVGVQINS
jgi:hypothetical protein